MHRIADPTLDGPRHPIGVAALSLLLVNDHVGKPYFPGWWTGKLSDVAWLVVGALVVAAVARTLGVGRRASEVGALVAVGGVYTTLQLWAPLGDTWAGWFGKAHVADAGDLIVLPALAFAAVAWRSARPVGVPRAVAVVASGLACVATSLTDCPTFRIPEDGAEDVDPDAPLVLGFGHELVHEDDPFLLSHIRLVDEDGLEVDFVAVAEGNRLFLCAERGLRPDMAYEWFVEASTHTSPNHVQTPRPDVGRTTFRTGPATQDDPERGRAACLDAGLEIEAICGDTGW